ncbi:MAG: DUF1761 domain-containing protein [bacterium]
MPGIHFWTILVCGVFAMIFGALWYGPLFGKLWMHINGVTKAHAGKQMGMNKKTLPLYTAQFLLTLFQLFILVHLVGYTALGGMMSAFWVWAGFILPTIAGSCMWTNESRKMAWSRFLVQSGYQLVCMLVFGAVLGAW